MKERKTAIDTVVYNVLARSEKNMRNIPDTIKAARIRAGMTQQELGEKMGYEGSTAQVSVRRWEAGSRPVPLEKVRALAAALGLTLDDLIP